MFKRLRNDFKPEDIEIFQGKRQAAVLVLLYTDLWGNMRCVLTVRSNTLSTHPGEIAFPGGKCDPEDTNLLETARREAFEEIGVNKNDYTILSILPPTISRVSNYLVTPVIARLYKKRPSFPIVCPAEVEKVFSVPLKKFICASHYSFYTIEDGYELHCVKHSQYKVMGLTCNILIHTASIIYNESPEFPFTYLKVKHVDIDKVDVENQ